MILRSTLIFNVARELFNVIRNSLGVPRGSKVSSSVTL